MADMTEASPLTPAVFYILLALAGGDKHGYAIMKQVRADSGAGVKMGNGTLYGSIKRMLADDLIEDAGDRVDPALDDERRRYYRLTANGRRALNAEMQRYLAVAALIRERALIKERALINEGQLGPKSLARVGL
jgi:DNA-binding PadR family transcriptional regulator